MSAALGAVLDGTDDEVNIDGVQAAVAGGTAVTWCSWIYPIAYGDSGSAYIVSIVGDDNAPAGTFTVRLGVDGLTGTKARLYGHIINAASVRVAVSGASDVPLDQWSHVAFVWEKNNALKLYLNGVEDGSAAPGYLNIKTATTSTLFIGDDDTMSRNWTGYIDDAMAFTINATALIADIIANSTGSHA